MQPGHVFPLRAKDGGVLRRAGHTEAAVDLARMAGLQPAGVLCEILHDDGTMARLPELMEFRKKHGLRICTIQSLIAHRRVREKLVEARADREIADRLRRLSICIFIDRSWTARITSRW